MPYLSAVCRSAATASPPVRAAEPQSTASQGRAGGDAEQWGRARRSEAESLDRCARLGHPHGGERYHVRRDLATREPDGATPLEVRTELPRPGPSQ